MTTRSGFRKSLSAAPSFRNSGLAHTRTRWSVSASIASRTSRAVPTGTVLLVITIRSPSIARPMPAAAATTALRSAEPSSSGGVPTAMKMMYDARTAPATSVVKERRPSATFRLTSALRPGS